ncbi:unnamed protein product, partial [marine sediment metagenome]
PKGTRIRKVNTKAGDAHQDGALGTIVGALGPASPSQRAELIIELAKKGMNGDIEYFYWFEKVFGMPYLLHELDRPPLIIYFSTFIPELLN